MLADYSMLTSAAKYTDVFDITSTMLFPHILLMMLDNFLNKHSGHILEIAPSDVRLYVRFKTFKNVASLFRDMERENDDSY